MGDSIVEEIGTHCIAHAHKIISLGRPFVVDLRHDLRAVTS
jgi:hypothetical protein